MRARIAHELKIIGDKHYADYFLVVEEIVRQAPRTCGRGSGAASIVSYCLGITHVDPIRHNLRTLLERRQRIRTVGFRGDHLASVVEQLALFPEVTSEGRSCAKDHRLALDQLKTRFGPDIVAWGQTPRSVIPL